MEKELGFSRKADIEGFGIDKFNARCRESVFRYLKEWNELTERIAFWVDLEWLPWGKELYDICTAFAPTVLMSTPAPMGGAPMSAAGKLTWIARNLPDADYALTGCKHLFNPTGQLLIDDRQKNVDTFREHGGDAILIPAPWNSEARWPTKDEVLDLVTTWMHNETE